VDAWAGVLVSEVPIRLRVSFIPLNTRGLCIPHPIRDFEGAPSADTWYPASLADAIAGWDLRPGDYDMEMFFSTHTDWYFGVDGKAPPGQSDLVFVAMHEICHGLGFASLLKLRGGVGSYGKNVFDKLPPVSFSLPDLAGLPSVFDRFVENDAGQRLVDPSLFPNSSKRLGKQLTTNRLFFGGSNAIRRNHNQRPQLHGPDPSHLDRASFENDGADAMMTPGPRQPTVTDAPGPAVIGVLEDLGWTLSETEPAE
jgi:hypothetical protein